LTTTTRTRGAFPLPLLSLPPPYTHNSLCSGSISFNEAYKALSNFGYRLSEPIMQLMFYSYDADRTGALGFDEFVQMNSELSSMTNMFRKYDTNGTGVATINYEQFLSMVLTLKASDE